MSNPQITVYGTPWCGDCKRAMRVLDQQKVSYQYINIEIDDGGRSYVEQVNRGYQSVPTIVFPDGSVLVEPSSSVLTQKLATLG
jgi:mycoredoxin